MKGLLSIGFGMFMAIFSLFVRPLPLSWIIGGILIGFLFILIGFGVTLYPTLTIEYEEEQPPVEAPEPLQESVDEDYKLEGAQVVNLEHGVIRLETLEGPKFLMKKTGEASFWAHQIDATGRYIGAPIQGSPVEVSKQIKLRVRSRARRRS